MILGTSSARGLSGVSAPPQGTTSRARDRGSGSVLALAGIAVLLSVGSSALLVVGAVRSAHTAAAAADLAALAAAGRAVAGESSTEACARAVSVARANGAVLRTCRVDGAVALVSVTVAVPPPLSTVTGPAVARARAGPAPTSASLP